MEQVKRIEGSDIKAVNLNDTCYKYIYFFIDKKDMFNSLTNNCY